MASLFVSNQCFIPHQVRAEKWYVLHCIEVSWRSLQYASDGLKNDKYVVLAAVRKNGLALQYASEALKRDNEVVIAAMLNDLKSLQYASTNLLSDKGFVVAVLQINGCALKFVPLSIRLDKELALVAIKQKWYAIMHWPFELRDDKEMVVAAVTASWKALQYASDNLRGDVDVICAAISQSIQSLDALEYASKSPEHNVVVKSAFTYAVQSEGYVLRFASSAIRSDKELVLHAVKQNGIALEFASVELKGDLDVVFAATAHSMGALFWASVDLGRRGGLKKYVERLLCVYNVPVSVFVATVLASTTSKRLFIQRTRLVRSDLVHVSQRPRCECGVMSRLNLLGEEGRTDFLKKLAAYAGVPLKRMGCPVPWQSVRSFVITSMWFNDDGVLLKSIR